MPKKGDKDPEEVAIDKGDKGDPEEAGKKGNTKRKGSPSLHKHTPLKRQNSLPDISATLKQPTSFSDMMLMSFKEKQFVNTFSPLLCEMISPIVQQAVKIAVESEHGSVVEKMVQSNRELQELVKMQMDTIDTQNKLIQSQKDQLQTNTKEIKSLKSEVNILRTTLESVKLHSNDLEQYGRRNSVRLSNFNAGINLTESDYINEMVDFLNFKILSEEEEIRPSDIERCHPIGGKNLRGKCQFLVEFSSYKVKAKVFSKKSKLKNNSEKIFMTEDLTKANHAIVQSLIQLKKAGKINSFWTKNGTVYAKAKPDGAPVKLRNQADVSSNFDS